MSAKPSGADGLLACVKALREYFERNTALSERTAFGITSAFWRGMFEGRSNFPDLNGLIAFRRGDFSYGLGEERQGDESAERRHFERLAYIIQHSVPEQFVRALPEPLFGAPYLFDYQGSPRSASFVVNSATAWHVSEQLRKAGLVKKALDICEIGPGWGGCAYQLHQVLPIRSCTLIDLPENLLLSATYLLNTLQDRMLDTVEVAGAVLDLPAAGALRIVLPGGVERLKGKYDLVLNTFSLQEMEKTTVERYLGWVLEHLSPDGIFVSINSHGKAGMRAPRDYGFNRFEIRHLSAFRAYPTGFFNTIPYAMTLGMRTSRSPDYSPEALDGLCGLMQLGLGADIQQFADAYAAGSLADNELAWLAACNRVFRSRDDARMQAMAAVRSGAPKPIADFVEAHVRLANREFRQAGVLLSEATAGLRVFALARARVILAALGQPLNEKSSFDAVRAYPEVGRYIQQKDLGAFARHFESILGSPP